MKTFFLEQSDRTGIFDKLFKKVTLSGNKILININLEKEKFKTKVIIAKRIVKILSNQKSRQIVVSRDLKNDKELMNLLYGYNISICSPKWILGQFTEQVIEEAIKKNKSDKKEIWICVNDLDLTIEQQIYKFAKEFKKINIITNHIGKFRNIEKKLYEEEGILINISNNKKKSLIKADLILNVDFPKEILNKFAIYDEATIINLGEEIQIKKKRFNRKSN